MAKLSVTIRLESTDGSATRVWDLDDAKVVHLMAWLLSEGGAPTEPTGPSLVGMRVVSGPDVHTNGHESALKIVDFLDRAYDSLGKKVVTTRELLDQMVADGWKTKSDDPINVVGSTLRDLKRRGRYRRVGDGWKRIADVGDSGRSHERPSGINPPIGPGLRQLITECIRSQGAATVDDLYAHVESQHPGEAKRPSIRSTASRMVAVGLLHKGPDGEYRLPSP